MKCLILLRGVKKYLNTINSKKIGLKNYKIAKNISHPIVKKAEGLSNEVSNSSVRFRAKNDIQELISDFLSYDWFLSGICPLYCCDEYRFLLGLSLK